MGRASAGSHPTMGSARYAEQAAFWHQDVPPTDRGGDPLEGLLRFDLRILEALGSRFLPDMSDFRAGPMLRLFAGESSMRWRIDELPLRQGWHRT